MNNMCPYIYFVLPSYSVMAFIGGIVILFFIFFRLERFMISFGDFLKLIFVSAVGVFLGSKVLFAFTQIPWLISNFSIENIMLLLLRSGYVFYGGLFGMMLTIMYITRKDLLYQKRVFQMITPAIPLFHFLGRIGCFFAGCCYGKRFVNNKVFCGVVIERIAVQLIEAISEMILFIIVMRIEKKHNDYNILKVYLVLYAIIRFLDEFLRGDSIRGIWFGLSTAQWISMGIIILFLAKGIIEGAKKRGLFWYFKEHGTTVSNPHNGIYCITESVFFPT